MSKKQQSRPQGADSREIQPSTADERLLAGSGEGRAAEQRSEVEQDAPPSNTASNNCMEGYFKALRWGVDSLYLSYQGELSSEMNARLRHLKELAQSEMPAESAQAQLQIGEHIFEVKDKGTKLFAFVLEDNAFRIQLAKPGRKVPMAYVKVSATYLAHVGPHKAEATLSEVLAQFGELTGSATVSRIDLCVDFVTTENMEGWDRHAWVTRASNLHTHAANGHFTGWSIGLGGVMSARLYNKLLEIGVSGKDWLLPLWHKIGWQPGEVVWRLEFELKREVLTQKGLSSFHEVMSNLNGLWDYAATEWLRLTLPNEEDKTRARWPIHPLWGYLASVDWETQGGPLSKRFSLTRGPKGERLYTLGYSVILSHMAQHGLDDFYEGAEDFLAAAYDYHNSRAFNLGLSFDDYIAEKLAEKRRQFNTRLNNPALNEDHQAGETTRQAEAYRKASRG